MSNAQENAEAISTPENVISIFAERSLKSKEKLAKGDHSFDKELSNFAQTQERLRKERMEANKSVIKSFKLKD